MTADNSTLAKEDLNRRENDVAEHLRSHPDFFERYPQLLSQLIIPHPTSGKAVSLLERQLQVIREQQDQTNRKLKTLISNARQNEQLQNCLESFALFLMKQVTKDKLIEKLAKAAIEHFDLEYAQLLKIDDRPELVAIVQQSESATCQTSPNVELCSRMFPEDYGSIRSLALIPLISDNGRQPLLLAFGSEDPKRYHQENGTRYLGTLQSMLVTTLKRLHADERTRLDGT